MTPGVFDVIGSSAADWRTRGGGGGGGVRVELEG